MFDHLQIYDRRERWMVGAADVTLGVIAAFARPFGRRRPAIEPPKRILLLRLERIGDLLMACPAIAAVRRLAPGATIDLVVGSWNEPIAQLFEEIDNVETLDAAWLARGARTPGFGGLIRRAHKWRTRRYDLAINFEGDIRTHLLMACSGAPARIGFDMAGGGPLLTSRARYDASCHVADNLLRLVERAFDVPPGSLERTQRRLKLPASARQAAEKLLGAGSVQLPGGPPRLNVGIQVGGGRQVKQWDPARFGEVAAAVAEKYGARLLFTGAAGDRRLVDAALARLPKGVDVLDACGRIDLLTLAALLERCSLLITGDTGPMHLAAAVGTPLVAIFGPSDPRRWGPLAANAHVVHSAIECRPCNRIRRPPSRCVGKVPDCLSAVAVVDVLAAVEKTLARSGDARAVAVRGSLEASDGGR